jgi:hypothetical protein
VSEEVQCGHLHILYFSPFAGRGAKTAIVVRLLFASCQRCLLTKVSLASVGVGIFRVRKYLCFLQVKLGR